MVPITSLFQRTRMAVSAAAISATGAFSASFLGSNSSPTRTDPSAIPLDTRKELTYFTRTQLIKKSRWLCNNLGIIRRFINGCARYTVGGGISHIPATTDEDWNSAADTYFTQWADEQLLCDVRGRLNFWRMQKKILTSMFRDGDCFAIKAPAPPEEMADGRTVLGRPRLQWLEAHVIASKNQNMWGGDLDEDGFREGIKLNSEGLATFYRVLEDKDPRVRDLMSERTIPQDAVMHILDDERASQVRGLPWMYHGVNSAIDILDLVSLEKHAVKLHSAMAAAIKKKTGDAGRGGFTGDLGKKRGTTVDGKKKVMALENFAGGAGILQLELDEEFQLFTSTRPSVTFAGFIDFLVRDMAWGFGISPEFIWSVSGLGGPNARVILEDAKWFFEELQDLLVSLFCKKVYTWVIARAMDRGELPQCKDPNWWVCDWIGPAKITIDQGRDGQLELDRLNSACGTWEDYWAARGQSGRRKVKQRIDELAWAMKYAEEKKVPFEYVVQMAPGSMSPGQQLDANTSGVDKVKRAQATTGSDLDEDLDA